MPCAVFILLAELLTATPAVGQETIPDPELLEMLGAMGDIENLGVDVDNMIGQQLDTENDDEKPELQK